jgi:TolA-binding protein
MREILDYEEMEPMEEDMEDVTEEVEDDFLDAMEETVEEEEADDFPDAVEEVTEETEEGAPEEAPEEVPEVPEDSEAPEEVSEEATKEAKKEAESEETGKDNLAFILNDNLSLYLASKAFYEDRNYEEAVAKFQSTIEYEQSRQKNALTSEASLKGDQQSEPNGVIAKSMYWMGEAYVKMRQIDKAIEMFEQLVRRFSKHYLSLAAQRRVATLKTNSLKERKSV